MTRTLNRSALTIAALVLVSSLAACGGGGSSAPAAGGGSTGGAGGGSTGGAGGGSNGGVVQIGSCGQCIPSAGTLVTVAGPSTYAADSVNDSAYNALNLVRIAAGAGAVSTSTLLDTAATAHSTYVYDNIDTVGVTHYEDSTKPGFYAYGPGERIAKAGYAFSNYGEIIGGNSISGTAGKGADYIYQMLDTVYHGAIVLSQNTQVGFGAVGGPDYLIVTDFGTPLAAVAGTPQVQVPGSGAVVAYPFSGQANVISLFNLDAETPRMPVALFPNAMVGTPVLVSIINADFINASIAGKLVPVVTSFTLKDAGGNLVPSTIVANQGIAAGAGVVVNVDAEVINGTVALVPQSPLVRGQTYTASFAATLTAGGVPVTKTWSFTTSPTN